MTRAGSQKEPVTAIGLASAAAWQAQAGNQLAHEAFEWMCLCFVAQANLMLFHWSDLYVHQGGSLQTEL